MRAAERRTLRNGSMATKEHWRTRNDRPKLPSIVEKAIAVLEGLLTLFSAMSGRDAQGGYALAQRGGGHHDRGAGGGLHLRRVFLCGGLDLRRRPDRAVGQDERNANSKMRPRNESMMADEIETTR